MSTYLQWKEKFVSVRRGEIIDLIQLNKSLLKWNEVSGEWEIRTNCSQTQWTKLLTLTRYILLYLRSKVVGSGPYIELVIYQAASSQLITSQLVGPVLYTLTSTQIVSSLLTLRGVICHIWSLSYLLWELLPDTWPTYLTYLMWITSYISVHCAKCNLAALTFVCV